MIVGLVRSPPETLELLEHLLSAHRGSGLQALIVAEGSPPTPKIEALVKHHASEPGCGPRLRYLSVEAATKGALLNEAAKHTDEQDSLLWFHDANVSLPLREVVEDCGQHPDADAIQPARSFLLLSMGQFRATLAGFGPAEETLREKRPIGQSLGKASFLVDREVFLALRGFDERFEGLADEGFELAKRLRRFFINVRTLPRHRGLIYRGPLSEAQKSERDANAVVRAALGAQLEEDPWAHQDRGVRSSLPADRQRLQRSIQSRRTQAALAITEHTPPPVRAETLPGEIWGVTTFFNPSGYLNKSENYRRFRQGLVDAGLPLLTVELTFGDRPFELDASDAQLLVQRRTTDVLWHKERLLNLGISQLPASCDKVVWLDADVLFERDDWVGRTAQLLERYVMVQPFSRSVRLKRGETALPGCEVTLPIGSAEHELLHGIAYGVMAKGHGALDRYLVHGHSGYAWAGRRAVLQKHGLYEANILGNADLNIAHAMFGGPDYVKTTRFSPKARAHLSRWATGFHEDVGSSVGFVDGTLLHLWHGDKKNRLYDQRLTVLKEHDFDPERDLSFDPQGVLRWSSDKPQLHAWCERYFDIRQEGEAANLASSEP